MDRLPFEHARFDKRLRGGNRAAGRIVIDCAGRYEFQRILTFAREKAVLKSPHSRRFANDGRLLISRSVWSAASSAPLSEWEQALIELSALGSLGSAATSGCRMTFILPGFYAPGFAFFPLSFARIQVKPFACF